MKSNHANVLPVEYESPSLIRVFAAMVYDSLLLAAVSLAYGAVVVALRVLIVGSPEAGQRVQWSLLLGALVSIGWLLTLVLFYAYFWHKWKKS